MAPYSAPHLQPKSQWPVSNLHVAMERAVEAELPAELGRDSAGRLVAPEALPHWHKFTIIAQDPSVKGDGTRGSAKGILRARVNVPADWLEPGPRSHRFHVVDYDETRGSFATPHVMTDGWTAADQFEEATDSALLKGASGEGFRAQNVYAIAARTLEIFETALGRRVNWSFGDHQLYLVPSAGAMTNAYYSPEDRAIVFGYFMQGRRLVQTCLFHDVIAHETTHAILDALRPRLIEPGLADQRAFHEGFSDIVALLSVFSVPQVVQRALRKVRAFDPVALKKSILFTLGEQWSLNNRGLRSWEQFDEEKAGENWDETRLDPHSRGEVIVWAMMQTVLDIWTERVGRLKDDDHIGAAWTEGSLLLAAEEGAKSAKHVLNMAIRALDYAPPAEIEFADFLDAMLVSDRAVAPDDDLKYREKLTHSFKQYGIEQPQEWVIDLKGVRNENLHFDFLQDDRDEVYRFIWQNAVLPRPEDAPEVEYTADGRPIRRGLGISRDFYTRVESVLPSRRVGPDGFIVSETAVSYIQYVDGSLIELLEISQTETPRTEGKFDIPEGLDPETRVRLYGAGAIIFDQYGRVKYHQAKPLENWDRQSKRLRQMQKLGIFDRQGGLDDAALRASLHEPREEKGEW